MNDTRPIIVAIEGADGSGKTRNVQAAVESLGRAGYRARVFHHAKPRTDDVVEAAKGYAFQRRALVEGLRDGDVLVADRWFWSTLALCNGFLREACTPERVAVGVSLRDIAARESESMRFGRVETWFDDTLPLVIANSPAQRAGVRMALVVLDARLAARGEPLPARRHGERAFYRRATCVDTSGETADLIVPRLVRWAVDGLRMGAL